MRDIRNGVTPGWLGFWELRVQPKGNYRERRHGNTKHGHYAKRSIGSMRLFRAMIRGQFTPQMASFLPKFSLGWQVYPYVRNPAPTDPNPPNG